MKNEKRIMYLLSYLLSINIILSSSITSFATTRYENSYGSIDMNDKNVSDAGIDNTQREETLYEEIENNKDNQETTVYVTQASTFSVIVPKTIILNGDNGNGQYEVLVKCNLASDEEIHVIPDETFILSSLNKNDIIANLEQDKTSWKWDENNIKSHGKIIANLTAGKWHGIFNFNIAFKDFNIKQTEQIESIRSIVPFTIQQDVINDIENNNTTIIESIYNQAQEEAAEFFVANLYSYCSIDSTTLYSNLTSIGQNNGDYGLVSEINNSWNTTIATTQEELEKYPNGSIYADIKKVTHSPKGISSIDTSYSNGILTVKPQIMRWADTTMRTTIWYDILYFYPTLKSDIETPIELTKNHIDENEIIDSNVLDQYDTLDDLYENAYEFVNDNQIELHYHVNGVDIANVLVDVYNKGIEDGFTKLKENPFKYINMIHKEYNLASILCSKGLTSSAYGSPWGNNYFSSSPNVALSTYIGEDEATKMTSKSMCVTTTDIGGTNCKSATFGHSYNEQTGMLYTPFNLGGGGKCSIILHTFTAEPKSNIGELLFQQ